MRSALWAASGCLLVFLAGALTYRYEHGPAPSIPIYMLFTFLVAWRGGFRASIPVAIASTLGLDYFFTEPRFALRVTSLQDVFSLVSFAGVSLLVSHLSNRIRSHAAKLQQAEAEQRALYELSQSMLLLDWNVPQGDELCELCRNKLHLDGVALWVEKEKQFSYAGDVSDTQESLIASFRAKHDTDIPARREHIRVLRFGTREIGALCLHGSIDPLMVNAIGSLFSTHLERAKALRAEVSAVSQTVSERLRTAVLDGLAHAVKTPLTTILVSSSGLKEIGTLSPLQNELASVIQGQASHLAALTDKLLRTAKLEAGEVSVRRQPTSLKCLLQSALDELPAEYDTWRVRAVFSDESKLVSLDEGLMRMAIVQIVENALKYSPGNSKVAFHAEHTPASLEISIHNEGTYIPPGERALVFERYYRSPSVEHCAPGTGIGLSVTKQSIEAQGGRVWIDSDPINGTTFYISIPLEEER